METLSQRMKRLRLAKGLSISELSRTIGVPQTTYREWEYGRAIKGEPYLVLAKAFDVSLFELLTGEQPKPAQLLKEIVRVQELIQAIRKNLQSWN